MLRRGHHLKEMVKSRPRGYKKNCMFKSAEHEILNAHKYKYIKKFSFLSGPDKPRMLIFLLINVKIIVGFFVGIFPAHKC